jgi:hypothetical protein
MRAIQINYEAAFRNCLEKKTFDNSKESRIRTRDQRISIKNFSRCNSKFMKLGKLFFFFNLKGILCLEQRSFLTWETASLLTSSNESEVVVDRKELGMAGRRLIYCKPLTTVKGF